jgi:hypothetical protein
MRFKESRCERKTRTGCSDLSIMDITCGRYARSAIILREDKGEFATTVVGVEDSSLIQHPVYTTVSK